MTACQRISQAASMPRYRQPTTAWLILLQLWREAMGWGSIRIFFLRIFLWLLRLFANMKKADQEYFRSLASPPVRFSDHSTV